MSNTLEDEIQVIRSCQRQLDKLTPNGRIRVLSYLANAAGEALEVAGVGPARHAPGAPTLAAPGEAKDPFG